MLILVNPPKTSAAEALPSGTLIIVPVPGKIVVPPPQAHGHEIKSTVTLMEEHVLLTSTEARQALLGLKDFESCLVWLEDCEKRQLGKAPKDGYFTTPQGHAVMIGGFTISISAAFVLGVVLVK